MSNVVVKDSILQKYHTTLTDNIYKDQNGYLVCEGAILGRTGSQDYTKRELGLAPTNDIVSVYRLEEYVFDSASMLSLEGRPLTKNHPNELVNAENHNKYAKGEVFNVRREENNLVGDIRVHDPSVIKLILDKNMRELSLGYTQDLEFDEQKGIYYFTNIVYNHIALVKNGRAGNAIIKDSVEEDVIEEAKGVNMNEELMNTILEKLNGMQEQINGLKVETPKVEEPKVEPVVEQKVETKVEYVSPTEEQLESIINKVIASQKVEPKVEEPIPTKVEVAPTDEQKSNSDISYQKTLYEFQKNDNETQSEYEKRLSGLVHNKSIKRQYIESQH